MCFPSHKDGESDTESTTIEVGETSGSRVGVVSPDGHRIEGGSSGPGTWDLDTQGGPLPPSPKDDGS